MRLQLHERAFLEVHVPDDDLGALFEEQVVHHPKRDVHIAFFRGEFKHTAKALLAELRVLNHKRHWVGDLQAPQLMQRTSRHDDYKYCKEI